MAPPLITLMTDFGRRDGYAAAMVGVIATRAPEARVVEVSHEIAPQNLAEAALVWSSAVEYFPPGTIHVAVVDPGVGSRRKILAVAARESLFLVPDNGLIGGVLARREILAVHDVRRRDLFLPSVSRTFHGRDIFAPVAAALAQGLPLERVGPRVKQFAFTETPRPRRRRRGATVTERGEVIHVDRFGNLITNVRLDAERTFTGLEIAGTELRSLSTHYGHGPQGRLLVLVASSDYLEVASRGASAAAQLDVSVGEVVRVRWEE